MPRLLPILLAVQLLFHPLFSFAQEAIQTPELLDVPIYFFTSDRDDLLAIAPLTDGLFIWAYATSFTNGNLTSDSLWTHTWDYRNRLTQSTKSGATSTYSYDHINTRVRLTTASTTLIEPSANYSTENGTAVKYIYVNGQLVATVRGSGASSTLYAIHTDHLGSLEKTTNASGTLTELSDYYPYGAVRQDTGIPDDRKGYVGRDYDEDTGLGQFGARYFKSAVGRFISQDPVFWEVGQTSDGKAALSNPQTLNSGRTMGGLNSGFASGWSGNTRSRGNSISQAEWLADPQAQNSYGYARNNPIKYIDPDGEAYQIPIALGLGFAGGVVGQYYSDVVNNYQSGAQGLSVFKPASSIETYGVRGTQGAIVGASALTGSPYIIGGATVGTSVLGNQWLGQQTNLTQTGVDAVLNAGTAGVFKLFPGVPGRLPNFGTQAFFTGKHTQQELTKEAINVLIGGIKDTINAISNSIKELKKSK